MEVERCEFKAEMKRAYEAEIEAKEHSLLERLDREQEQLREEKRTVEETLQKEMERVLDEKNIHLKVATFTFYILLFFFLSPFSVVSWEG